MLQVRDNTWVHMRVRGSSDVLPGGTRTELRELPTAQGAQYTRHFTHILTQQENMEGKFRPITGTEDCHN
jgi:hypothetical protein